MPPLGLGENGNAGRIAMEKIPSPDRSHFPLRKKTGERDGAQLFAQHGCVVVRHAKQPFAASATTEQQRAERM
jgi:hypothetical protein